jgi:multiple sugar transport system permease protein
MGTSTANRDLPGIYHKAGSLSSERRWALWTAYISLIFAAIIFLAPPVYMFITSLKTSAEVANLQGNPWLVRDPTLENYTAILTNPTFLTFFWNSAKITVMVVTITMVISTLAAFALARMRFWGSQALATGVFLTYLIPETLLFIPLYQIVGGLGLLNSSWGLVVVYPTLTVPFCTWIMIGYFASIPKELDEAARIDGCTRFSAFLRITLPLSTPALASYGAIVFIVAWNDLLVPLILNNRAEFMTLPVVIASLVGDTFVVFNLLMAICLVALLPSVLLVMLLRKFVVEGLTGFGILHQVGLGALVDGYTACRTQYLPFCF